MSPRIRRRGKIRQDALALNTRTLHHLVTGHDFGFLDPEPSRVMAPPAPDDVLAGLWSVFGERITLWFADPESDSELEAMRCGLNILDREEIRPWGWWQYQAPEPRRRLGGIGTPLPDSPMSWGMPTSFADDYDVRNPPTYEDAETYLERLGLLTDAERWELDR